MVEIGRRKGGRQGIDRFFKTNVWKTVRCEGVERRGGMSDHLRGACVANMKCGEGL